MPFRIKNAGAIYQRMATTLLHDMMHNEVKVYVDDMIMKSKDREGQIANLRKFFERIKEYRLRLNPQKCTFGVIARKLLGFLASNRGIKVDPSKIKAILDMPPSKNEKEIRGFIGRFQYISFFIAKLTFTYEPIFKLLRTNEPIHGMMSVRRPLSLSMSTFSIHLSWYLQNLGNRYFFTSLS